MKKTLFDFETTDDLFEAEKLFGAGNIALENEIKALQRNRLPTSVAGKLEELRQQFDARMDRWANYQNTRLVEWLKAWPQTQQAMNDNERDLDQQILQKLHEARKLCYLRAEAACYRRAAHLKYAENLAGEEKYSFRTRQIRVNGQVVNVSSSGAESIQGEVFAIFADFAKANPDLTPFIK